MKALFQIILILWLVFPTPDKILAAEKSAPAPTLPPTNKQPLEISADSVEQFADKNLVIAKGHVVVRFGGRTIRADRITINTVTKIGEAIGHVIILDTGTALKARRMTFDMTKQQGRIYNTQGRVGKKFRIRAREATKLSPTHFTTHGAALTTCKGHLPDWMIQAESIDLKMGNRALFKKGVFKVRGVPVLYAPIGYIPLNNERKSGFLVPGVGSSNTNGFTFRPAYFWAINRHSDATFFLDYLSKRGVRPGIEYRYTPSKTTQGQFRGEVLQDNSTNNLFYKIFWTHNQILPNDFRLQGKLDLLGDNNFDKTFNDNNAFRTRRSTDSFVSLTKAWRNNSLDVVARLRDSTEDARDDTFGLLPQAILKTQKHKIGKTPFYFNQDTTFSGFLVDLDPSSLRDDKKFFARFDVHPQLSITARPTPWLSVTPTVGVRETLYGKGIDTNNNTQGGFTRELFDIRTVLEGPKFKKVYHTNSERVPKLKHLIEPRITYDFIPEVDEKDRERIKIFDSIDTIKAVNQIQYSLTQRLFKKNRVKNNKFQTLQIMRFEISQSYNIREATRNDFPSGKTRRPFSPVRFDLDSRFFDPFMVNIDSTYDVEKSNLNTFNVELGIRPLKNLSFFVERRFTRNLSTFLLGTLDMTLGKGFRFTYSTRYDERLNKFQENDASIGYNDKCRCWGFSFDVIRRNNINGGIVQKETKFMFNLELRGLGKVGTRKRERLLHRYFTGDSIDTNYRYPGYSR